MRLWGIIRKNHKIYKQETVPLASASLCDVCDAMGELTKIFDISRPVLLTKHENDIEQFSRASFLPDDFIDSVNFDRFEIQILHDDDRKRRSSDPRNDFSF
ncbi:MAG: hypothetical protein IJF16_04940 [Clostridia bacterium]|nr:hypothetical protein [Clostridia bacterium]